MKINEDLYKIGILSNNNLRHKQLLYSHNVCNFCNNKKNICHLNVKLNDSIKPKKIINIYNKNNKSDSCKYAY